MLIMNAKHSMEKQTHTHLIDNAELQLNKPVSAGMVWECIPAKGALYLLLTGL
jgi:hypothetical protein